MEANDPRAIEVLYALGHALLEDGRHGDAFHVFRTMLFAAPSDERAWLGLGTCHERNGEDAVALRVYSLGSASSRHSYRCHLARARVLRRTNELALADEAYGEAEERAAEHDEEVAAEIADERGAA